VATGPGGVLPAGRCRLAEARPLAERALAITQAAYGPDNPDVGIRLRNLAAILRGLGLAGEADKLRDRVRNLGPGC
jgi:Tetratricopeptide repeat